MTRLNSGIIDGVDRDAQALVGRLANDPFATPGDAA